MTLTRAINKFKMNERGSLVDERWKKKINNEQIEINQIEEQTKQRFKKNEQRLKICGTISSVLMYV